jgi:Ser/Thr protein kinase RdoA (MazF antagonist)
LIEHQYAIRIAQLQPLAQGDKQVYRVRRTEGPDWVARVYPVGEEQGPSASKLASVLRFLERQAYPAERLIPTKDGSLITVHGDQQVAATTYLGESLHSWQPPSSASISLAQETARTCDPAMFGALGAALGQLHALRPDADSPMPPAGMLPQRELAWVADLLAEVAGRVPQELQADYDHWVMAVRALDRCEDLPVVLIHNDCNLGNVVLTPAGEVALVDWDLAGLGPAVIDVGILLRNCFSKQTSQVEHDAITAVVDGYCRYRQLTPDELRHLPDAVRFMTLVLLAACFPDRIDGTLDDETLIYGATYPAWQAQYDAATEIAALARARFEQHRSNAHLC